MSIYRCSSSEWSGSRIVFEKGYVNGFCVQFQTECGYNFKDCVETWASFPREGLVKTFSRQTSITRHLRHAPGTGDIAQSFSNESSVTICILKASF